MEGLGQQLCRLRLREYKWVVGGEQWVLPHTTKAGCHSTSFFVHSSCSPRCKSTAVTSVRRTDYSRIHHHLGLLKFCGKMLGGLPLTQIRSSSHTCHIRFMNPSSPSPGSLLSFLSFLHVLFILFVWNLVFVPARFHIFSESESV
jgi:hypothetical protein